MGPLAAPTAPSPQPVSVRGGAGGITARCDEIVAMARRFGAAATDTLHAAWTLHGYLVHPGLAESALFDPVGYAEFEVDLLDALDGLHGLTWVGVQSGVIDGELRLAAAGYEAADQLYNEAHDAALGVAELPAALIAAADALVTTGDPITAAQAGIARDPEMADVIVDALGIPALLTAGALLLPDGRGVVHSLGRDTRGVAGQPPRRLTDVVRDLEQRNDDSHHGAIDVRILTLPDGSRRAIVDITGTKSWSITATDDITSLTTNGRALVGDRTAYEQGVLAAMHEAGVQPGDDVMLVGHSEGGLVAVNTARDAARSGEFNVTHVITAGAPVGLTVGQLPGKVRVLALENAKDVVPHLDGVANPDKPNVTTASSSHGNGTVGDDHGLKSAYVPEAADVQASDDKSIRDFLSSASGYFQATGVSTHAYQVTRRY
jgi:pimeloyl-ACP methyl ester carboxylesterase